MASFSLVFIVGAISLYSLGFGDASLVYANILNLSARIAYAMSFISTYFHSHDCSEGLIWTRAMPQRRVVIVCILSWLLVFISSSCSNATAIVRAEGKAAFLQSAVITHIALGVVSCLTCIAVWWSSFPTIFRRVKKD